MAGNGNEATHQWASAPDFCPVQYTLQMFGVDEPTYACRFSGAVSVVVQGAPWSRVWWSSDDSVTEYMPAAKAQLGSWDPRFDADLAVWRAAQPVVPAEPIN